MHLGKSFRFPIFTPLIGSYNVQLSGIIAVTRGVMDIHDVNCYSRVSERLRVYLGDGTS